MSTELTKRLESLGLTPGEIDRFYPGDHHYERLMDLTDLELIIIFPEYLDALQNYSGIGLPPAILWSKKFSYFKTYK